MINDLHRFMGGVADAAAWGSVVSILMKLFPNHVTTIASWTEMLLGLGYMMGKKIANDWLVRKKYQNYTLITLIANADYMPHRKMDPARSV